MKINIKRTYLFLVGFISILWTTQAFAVSPNNVIVTDNKLQASISLTPTIKLDVLIQFEKSVGLTADSIAIDASLIPLNDTDVMSRIASNAVDLHPDFPVLLSISPKGDKGFSFEGLATVEIYTKAIDYQAGMPAKIFTSHQGDDFEDITTMVSAGSLRARGNTGRFSDFIIVLDERSLKVDVESKLARIEQILLTNQSALSSVLSNQLQTAVSVLETAVILNNFDQALELTDDFIHLVEGLTGEQIDNVWRSSNDLVNVKGDLLSTLKSLRYSLRL